MMENDKKTRNGRNRLAGAVLLGLGAVGVTMAATPLARSDAEAAAFDTAVIEGTPEALAGFMTAYPDSPLARNLQLADKPVVTIGPDGTYSVEDDETDHENNDDFDY